MECPHCRSEIEAKPHLFSLGEDQDGAWKVSNLRCPTCDRLVISLCDQRGGCHPILPQDSCRPRLTADVPEEWASDYGTACRVLPHSAEASAALSRRLLHKLLAVKAGGGHGDLSDQIRQTVISSDLPPYLKQSLQTLTRVAKLEPGSSKSIRPEALAPVEPGEAVWLLDILIAMFDLYFVLPAQMERRQTTLENLIAQAAATDAPGAVCVAAGQVAAAPAVPPGAVAGATPQAAATPQTPAAAASESRSEAADSGSASL